MEDYAELGHPYVSDYSLMPWVPTVSPSMVTVFNKTEFIEVDAIFAASIELEYLHNVVCFDHDSLQCIYIQ